MLKMKVLITMLSSALSGCEESPYVTRTNTPATATNTEATSTVEAGEARDLEISNTVLKIPAQSTKSKIRVSLKRIEATELSSDHFILGSVIGEPITIEAVDLASGAPLDATDLIAPWQVIQKVQRQQGAMPIWVLYKTDRGGAVDKGSFAYEDPSSSLVLSQRSISLEISEPNMQLMLAELELQPEEFSDAEGTQTIIRKGTSTGTGSSTETETTGSSPSAAQPPEELLLHLKFDEIAADSIPGGYDFADASSYQHHAQIDASGNVTLNAPGKFGQSIAVIEGEGVHSTRVSIPSNEKLSFSAPSSPFTVSLWLKGSPSDGTLTLIDKRNSSLPNRGYHVFIEGNKIGVQLNHDAINEYGPYGSDVLNGQWRHLAAVFDGSRLTLYLDSVVVANEVLVYADSKLGLGNNQPLAIGGHSFISAFAFAGNLDEVRLYDRALTSVEIQVLWEQ